MLRPSPSEEPCSGSFIPPNGDFRPISNLSVELLSRIFQFGINNNLQGDVRDPRSTQTDSEPGWHVDNNTCVGDDEISKMGADKGTGDADPADDVEHIGRPSSHARLPRSFQVVVSHVCHHWRNAAISTPFLWTCISVSPVSQPPYQHVATFLKRSKCLPIDIRIRLGSQECGVHRRTESTLLAIADVELLYSLLVAHVHRWRSIDVKAASHQQMYAFLDAVSKSSVTAAPQLISLVLTADKAIKATQFRIVENSFTPFGGSTPSLKSIILGSVFVDWNQNWISHASLLTVLELRGHSDDMSPSWDEFSTILRSAPALERLVLHGSGPPGVPPNWEPDPERGALVANPIPLLKLMYLSLWYQSQVCICGLLRTLYAPALKSLSIAFLWDNYTEFLAHATVPVTIPATLSIEEPPHSLLRSIETLETYCPFYGTEAIEMLYDELESVTSLTISMDDFWYTNSGCAHILPLLPRAAEDNCGAVRLRVPRLETLSVFYASSDTHFLVLRNAVQRRRDAGFPINSVHVQSTCDIDEEDAAWFVANLNTFLFSRHDAER